MQAFHNHPAIKDFYIQRLEDHYAADEITQGIYWHLGNGCAVGCTIHGDCHSHYESELGIPKCLARLEDYLFEDMSAADAKEWPLRFLRAIPIGADLSLVPRQFVAHLLTEALARQYDTPLQHDVVGVVNHCVMLCNKTRIAQLEWSEIQGRVHSMMQDELDESGNGMRLLATIQWLMTVGLLPGTPHYLNPRFGRCDVLYGGLERASVKAKHLSDVLESLLSQAPSNRYQDNTI